MLILLQIIINLFFYKYFKNFDKISFILLIILGILFWGNINNPDYYPYYDFYQNNENYYNFEFGYVLVNNIISSLPIDYDFFLFIIFNMCLFLILNTIDLFDVKIWPILFLYSIYPFFFDVAQLRNFIGLSFFIFAFKYLLYNKKIIYIILTMIASSFQILFIVFVFFILIRSRFIRFIMLIPITAIFILIINDKNIIWFNNLMTYLSLDITYLSNKGNYGFIIYIFAHLFMIFSIWLGIRNIKLDPNNFKLQILNKVTLLNYYLISFYPLLMINNNFFRIYRDIILINYAALITIVQFLPNRKMKVNFIIIIIINATLYVIFENLPQLNRLILEILNNNQYF